MMPAFLVLFGMMFVGLLAVQGYAMKFSVNLLDAGPIGFFYGLLTAILVSIGGGLSSVAIMMLAGSTNPWVSFFYSVATGVVILALMVRCNPFKAFFAYLCHLFFSVVGSMGIAIAVAFVVFIGMKTNMIEPPQDSSTMFESMQANRESDTANITTAVFASEVPDAKRPAMKSEDEPFALPINIGGGKVQINPFSQ